MFLLLSTAMAYQGLNFEGVSTLYRPQAQSCDSGWIMHTKNKMFVRVFVGESEIYVLDWLEDMKLNYERYFPKIDEELSMQLGHEIYNGSERVFMGHIDNVAYVINAKPYLGENARALLPQMHLLFIEGDFETPPSPTVNQIDSSTWSISGTVRYTDGVLNKSAPNTFERLFFSELPTELCVFYPDGRQKNWMLNNGNYIEKPLVLKHSDLLKATGSFEHLGLPIPPEETSPEPKEELILPSTEEVNRLKSLRFWLKNKPNPPQDPQQPPQ
ncbi:MAG: hypothetical protein CMK59_09260 [Proteobacteria bacterium]|nr:hypothetical protein [Pseudomonadota bacterium]